MTTENSDVENELSSWTLKTHQLGTTIVPKGAIKCNSSGDGDGCYLGISVYSDGICEETLGKINMNLQFNGKTKRRYALAYTISYWNGENENEWMAEAGTCPFFRFLIQNDEL